MLFQIFNIVGLVFNISGTFITLRNSTNNKFTTYIYTSPEVKEKQKEQKKKAFNNTLGIVFIIMGTTLQLVSVFIALYLS